MIGLLATMGLAGITIYVCFNLEGTKNENYGPVDINHKQIGHED